MWPCYTSRTSRVQVDGMPKVSSGCVSVGLMLCVASAMAQADPHTMKATGKVDPRFQSFNVEMVEVIGGRFWKPYAATPVRDMPVPTGAFGIDPALYEQRTPVDLSDPRLRKMAAALGPTYLRVSGSWANTVYFQDKDAPAPAKPPEGFGGVLTRAEWKGVAAFAKAIDAEIVTSFSVTAGTRDASGAWQPQQAEAFLRYTKSIGAPIAAAEFFNEPTFATIANVPKGYDAQAYGRDFATFKPVFRREAPGAVLLGPGAVGEGVPLGVGGLMQMLPTAQLLQEPGAAEVDAFSYHFYPTVSERCAAHAPASAHIGTTPEAALTDAFLESTRTGEQFYAGLRDKYASKKPIWLTETGQAACGGDRWAATYLDSFRYLYQLGAMAKTNVQVVMHNTLDASDYGIINEKTLTPRPDYWAALLWHQLMDRTVLDVGEAPSPNVKLFAQCSKAGKGDVTLLALNLDRKQAHPISLAEGGERYTLTAASLQAGSVDLNDKALAVAEDGTAPTLQGAAVARGRIELAPVSITFFQIHARNRACLAASQSE